MMSIQKLLLTPQIFFFFSISTIFPLKRFPLPKMSKLSSPRGKPRAPPTSELEKENILEVKAPTSGSCAASSAAAKQLDNYIIVDVGANLTNKKFSRDLDSVIQRAKDSGVTKIMVTGTSVQSSRDALRLSRLYPGALYATAGK